MEKDILIIMVMILVPMMMLVPMTMLVPMILLVPMMMFIVIEPDVDFEISHEESVAEVVW